MNRQLKMYHWLPRIICMAGIAFITTLSLDFYTPNLPLPQLIGSALRHLSFSIALTILLAVAWKWERTGGIILLAVGLLLAPFVYILNHGHNHFSIVQSLLTVLIVNMPFVLAGALFLLSYHKKQQAHAIGNYQ
ncbi:hypothetical protein GCM10023093_26470 [Nemorincola caseinilytica]|uniref:DUF7670 domain-containing protein n=1 Tax=Nemorincola caseinilytica TaxID=2054315 RepID=A0ABP8NK47_9BACT